MGRWFEELTTGLVVDHTMTRTMTEMVDRGGTAACASV
jgi:hypothetical protein